MYDKQQYRAVLLAKIMTVKIYSGQSQYFHVREYVPGTVQYDMIRTEYLVIGVPVLVNGTTGTMCLLSRGYVTLVCQKARMVGVVGVVC
jgi:hypothetical protein